MSKPKSKLKIYWQCLLSFLFTIKIDEKKKEKITTFIKEEHAIAGYEIDVNFRYLMPARFHSCQCNNDVILIVDVTRKASYEAIGKTLGQERVCLNCLGHQFEEQRETIDEDD